MAVSVHAPYFAVLTVDEEEKRAKTLAALEHTLKLGRALGAHSIVAHTGYVKDRTPDQLHELVDEGISRIEPKVRNLGVALGLETSGSDRAFGSLGDIALIAGVSASSGRSSTGRTSTPSRAGRSPPRRRSPR